MSEKKKIFISFCFLDDEFAIALAEYLKEVLGEKNFYLYCVAFNNNYNSVKYGADFSEDFIKNVKCCDIFIPLLSLNYKRSPSALIELGAALALDKEITPLILPGSDYKDFNSIYNLRNREFYGIDNSEKIKKFLEHISNIISPPHLQEFAIDNFISKINIIKQSYIASIAEISSFALKLNNVSGQTEYNSIIKNLKNDGLIESSVMVVQNGAVKFCNIHLKKPYKLPDFKKYIESKKILDYKIDLID